MKKKLSKTKLSKALKQAHWNAMHSTNLEYRVNMWNDDGSVYVAEYAQGDRSWSTKATTLKTFCFWPSINDYWAGGPVDAITYRFMQGEYIRNELENDIEEIMNQIEEQEEEYHE